MFVVYSRSRSSPGLRQNFGGQSLGRCLCWCDGCLCMSACVVRIGVRAMSSLSGSVADHRRGCLPDVQRNKAALIDSLSLAYPLIPSIPSRVKMAKPLTEAESPTRTPSVHYRSTSLEDLQPQESKEQWRL